MQHLGNNIKLLRNFSSLTVLQIGNYIFPIITFPYLVRVLGAERYGFVSFVMAFVAYFNVFTDYGFNISATRWISVNKESIEETSKIFWSVISVRIFLLLISFVVFLPLVILIPSFFNNSHYYFFAFLSVIGTTFFPQWFFQGTEKMHFITLINISVKIIWLFSVFVFVTQPNHALRLIILNALSLLVTGIIGFLVAIIKYEIKIYFPKKEEIRFYLAKGKYVFLSTLSISLYTNSNVFLLGFIAGNEAAGFFAAADKIRFAVQGIFDNAARTVFPHVSAIFVKSKEAAVKFLIKYLKIIFLPLFIITLLIFTYSNEVVEIILGPGYSVSETILKVLIFLPVIILLSNFFGIQIMLNLGYEKEFSKIVLIAGVINIMLAIVLIPFFSAIGASWAVLLSEIFVTISMWFFVAKKELIK